MSSAEHFVRHHKRQTDRAISRAYARLATDECACEGFTELLRAVRNRGARLLNAPVIEGCHLGIEALTNLSRSRQGCVRTVATWSGCAGSWRSIVNSLAGHLVSRYPIPAFLGAAWYATDDAFGDAKRRWFIGHAAGAKFRSLGLPIGFTRRMEDIFLNSPDHFSVEYAMRRAELLGLGADGPLADAVLAARPSLDLHHGDFWRTAWHFLIARRQEIDIDQVAPLVDFFHAVRHEHVPIETSEGLVMRPPPLPAFSLKGRTVSSVMTLMEAWHRGNGDAGWSWASSHIRPLILEAPREDPATPPTFWELTELTNSGQLRAEGKALQHCVASYSYRCWKGRSRIWSLRRRQELTLRPLLTVEVHPMSRVIVQARGFRNRRASGRPLAILQMWAAREGLRLTM